MPLSIHAGKILNGFGKFIDRCLCVTVFDAVFDAVLQVPFEHHLPHFLNGMTPLTALIWIRMSSQGTSSSIMRSIASTCPLIFEPPVKIRRIHALTHYVFPLVH